jgi:hypothetical protein
LVDTFSEAGPAGAGVILIQRTKERLTGEDIHINTRSFLIPVFILKRGFSAVFLSYLILQGSKLLFEITGLKVSDKK